MATIDTRSKEEIIKELESCQSVEEQEVEE